ncbi:MAG: peptidyl-prolyl cis-trans isomerase [Rhizomicrobium sp.]
MLQEIRKYAKSWVSSVFMGALALSFALWGIADIFRGNADTTIYSIGSTQVGADLFAREFHNVMRNAGTALTPDQSKAAGQQILDRMITGSALDMIAAKLGLTATDARIRAQIQAMPVFNGALGTFDHDAFVQVISRAGYSEAEFVAAIRKDSARDQMLRSIEGGYLMPPDYARAIFAYVNELRAADYVVLTPTMIGSITPPSDDVLAAYVKSHPDRFSTPEYRAVSFASIGVDDVAPSIAITDKQIQDELDNNKSDYVVPEKREIEQIGFKSEDEAKAAKTALDGGKTFDALAADQKLKPAEYKLGELTEADLAIDPARAKAAFSLPVNGISAPVKGTFGWVLIHISKITAGTSKSHDDIKLALQRKLAAAKLTDMANAFTDAVGGGASIEEAARKSGMHFARIPSVDAQGLASDGSKTAAAATAEFLAQIFKSEVGDEGDPFPTADGHYITIKVDGVTPPKLKSLDTVRAQALAQWTAEQQIAQLKAKAAALVARANMTHSLDDVSKSLGAPIQASPALTRGTDDATFSKVLFASLFKAPAGGTVSGPTAGGGYVIARVTGIEHPLPPENNLGYLKGVRELSGQITNDISSSLAQAEQTREGLTINQKLVDSTVGNSGSGS